MSQNTSILGEEEPFDEEELRKDIIDELLFDEEFRKTIIEQIAYEARLEGCTPAKG